VSDRPPPAGVVTLSGHEVMAYYHHLQLMTNGQRIPKPNAVSLLNEKTGRRWGARRWLAAIRPAYQSMTGCRLCS
jgi:hypothetical protein